MIRSPSPSAAVAPLDVAAGVARRAACPLCHTAHPRPAADALEAGSDWQCVRCGQHWDAGRLATAGAFAAWTAEYDRGRRDAAAATA